MNAIKSYWNTEKISILIVSFLLLFFASFFHVDKAEASNWIEIRTVQDLKNIGKNPNGNYKLMNNINLNGQSTHNRETFKGKFDGQGYTISNGSSSLFYRLDSAEVSNLKLNNFNLNTTNTGLLAEFALNSNIKRVHTSGSIIHLVSGGLVGELSGNTTVEDVFTDVYVHGVVGGGIAAASVGTSNKIINSLAVGEVPWGRNKDGDYTTGGIVGFMQGNHQVTNTFYNRSIVKDGVNVGIGKTTSELRRKSTYTGWDFNHTWSIRDGSAYPTLNALNGIAPYVSLSKNSASTYARSQSTTIRVNSTGLGIKTLQYRWTTSTSFPTSGWTTVNGAQDTKYISVPTSAPTSTGNKYLHVKVTDVKGNVRNYTSGVFRIDRTPPSVSLSKNGGGYARSHSTKINVSDSHSGLSKVEYRWTTSSSFPTSGFTSGFNGTTTSAPTSTGNHYLHVRATDKAGNVRQFTSSVFRVDRTAPGQPTISAKSGWQTANQSVTIAHGSDSHSGVARTEYRLNNGSWTTYSGAISITSNGTTTVQARTIDKAGNISSTRSATVQIDKVNPTLNLSASTTAPTKNNVTITATGSDSHSGVKRIQKPGGSWVNGSSTTHVVSSNGTYQFVVEDNAGRTTTQSITVSNIDKTLPSVSLSKNGGGYAKSHSTTINASDSGSGLSKVEYRWTTSSTFPTSGFTSGSNGTTTSAPTSTGNHYLHVKATDKAGNVRQFTSSVFRIDRAAPTGSVSASTTAPTNKDVTLTASGADSHSGVKRIQKPNGSWVTGSSTTHVVSSNGTYKFVIEDNAGNTRTVEYTVANIDKTLPSISLSKNGGGYARSHSTTINVSDSGGSGLDKAEYRWTTNSSFPTSGFTATSNGATVNAPTSTGNHYLHVKAVDKAGNERQFTSNVFRIDRTAPSVNISASTTAPTNKDVTLSVTASDSHSGVKRIQKPNGTWINGSSATHVVSTNGTYSFVVEDNAGNTKTETITVSNIDKVAPTLSLKASTTAPTNQNVVVTVNRSDDASGISVVKWATGNRNADWFNSNGTTLSGSTFTVTDNGTYSAYVRDKAGNVTVHTITISNIDRIPPTPATFNVSDNKWTNKDVVVTPVYPSDAHIKEVRIDGGEWKKFESEITFTKNGKLEARSRDEAGNWSKVSSYEVNNIDKVNPTLNLSIVNPSPTNGNVTVSAISEDADSGIQATKWLAGEKSASDVLAHGEVVSDKHFIAKENGVYSVATIDVAGNAIVKTIEVSNIDRIPPVDTTFTASITKWTNKAVKVDMVYPNDAYIKQVRVNGSSEWENYKGEITFEENGFVEARSRDKAGNWSNVTRYDVKNIDLVNPELSLKAKTTAPTNKDVVIDVTASDSDSGIDQLLWLAGDRQAAEILAYGVAVKDNQVVATENGIYSVLALDEAGNITVKKITVSNIDRIPPEKAVLSLDEDYWTNGNVTVSIKFPHDAHVKEVKVGNGEWKAYEGSIVLKSNNSVSARSYDEATNVSEVATVHVTNIDKVDPMLTLTPETTQPINKDIRITVNAKDDSSGVESIKWLAGSHDADDVLEKGVSIKSNFFTVPTNGVYSVVVQDRAKNTIVKKIEVKNIDKIAPESPALSVVENKNLFSLTYGDDEGLGTSHSEYRVNGGEWKVYEGQVYLSDGEYVFEAKTVDVAGNESKVVSIESIFYYEYLTDLEDSFDEWEEFYPEDELEDIRDIIDNLPPNAEEREELEERYDRGEQVAKGYCEEIMSPEACTTWKLIKLIDGYDRFYTGLSAVEKRFEKVSKDDEFYPMLSNHMERLRGNVSNYYEQLREDKDINDAFSRVEDVEERYSPTREQAARNAITKLIDEELQNHLLERLETAIQAHKEAGLEEAIQKAIERVEIAENNPSTVNIKLAQNAVDNLPEGETKESLLERINALLPEKEEGPTEEELLQQQIDEAIALVEKAEKNYTTVNRIMATNAVNALPDSDIKTELLERLYLLENPVVEVDEEAEAIQQATEAMDNAEKYRTKHYVKLAHEAIYDLSDSEEKELLLERLDELKSELGLDDKGLFDKAVQEIDRHLRSPNITIYKNRALNAIEDVINEDHRAILEAYMAGEITKEKLMASFGEEVKENEEG